MKNLANNYAQATYVKKLKKRVKEHAKDLQVIIKPEVEAKIDSDYKADLNDYMYKRQS